MAPHQKHSNILYEGDESRRSEALTYKDYIKRRMERERGKLELLIAKIGRITQLKR